MKKTGQLIFTSKEGEDIVKKVGVSYIYYLEILSDRRCAFNINEEVIEATANKTLYIRTPVSSMVTITGGASLNILYETGDSTSFGDKALQQFVGNGSLPTESQTIVGAINEIYSNPGLGSGGPSSGGTGFRYPNEKTLLKINESSLTKWNGYEVTISNNNRAINDLRNTDTEINKSIRDMASIGSQNKSNIEAIGKAVLETNEALNNSNQTTNATQQELKQTMATVDANSKNITLIQNTLTGQVEEIGQLSKENISMRAEIEKNSKELQDKAPLSRVEELESKVRTIEEMTSVEDEDFGVDPSKMIVESLITLRVDIDANKREIESLQKLTEQLDKKYSAALSNTTLDLSSKIKDNENLIKDNSKRVSDLAEITNTIVKDIDRIVSEQDSTGSKLSDINKSMATVLNGLEKLERQIVDINTISSKIYEDLTSEISKNSLSIKNLTADLKRHIDQFEDFKVKVQTQITGATDKLQSQIDEMKVTDLELRQELQRTGLESSQNKKEIAEVRVIQAELSDGLRKESVEIDGIKQSQINTENKLSNHLIDADGRHKELQSQIDETRAEGKILSEDIEQTKSSLTYLDGLIVDVSNQLVSKLDSTYKEEVDSKLTPMVDKQLAIEQDITNAKTDIEANKSEINNLKIRVSMVEQKPGTPGSEEPSEGLMSSLVDINNRVDANKTSISELEGKTTKAIEDLAAKDSLLDVSINEINDLLKEADKSRLDTYAALSERIDENLDKINNESNTNKAQDTLLLQLENTALNMEANIKKKADQSEVINIQEDLKSKADLSFVEELDKKINTKVDASELSSVVGDIASKADKTEVYELEKAVNSKIDDTSLTPIRDELSKKATAESLNSKADSSEVAALNENLLKKADKTDTDRIYVELEQKATKQEVESAVSVSTELSNRIDRVELSSKNAVEEVAQVKTNVSKNEVDISSLKNKIEILEATPPSAALTPGEAKELTNALNTLATKIDTTKKDIVDLNENKDRVKLELDSAKIERDQLSTKIVSLEEADGKIKEELFDHAAKLLKVNSDIDYLTIEHDKMVAAIDSLSLKAKEAEEGISSLLQELETSKLDTKTLSDKIASTTNTVFSLSQLYDTINSQVGSLASMATTTKNTLDYVSKVVDNSSNKITDIESNITKINDDIEKVKISVTDLESKISDVGAQGSTGGGSIESPYESVDLSAVTTINLKPGKMLSIDKWKNGTRTFTVVFPENLTTPTQMGFSIFLPDNMSYELRLFFSIKIANGQSTYPSNLYWQGGYEPEFLTTGRVHEFIFAYQSGKITGGSVSYVKK